MEPCYNETDVLRTLVITFTKDTKEAWLGQLMKDSN
jgi:hypothetical protein